MSAIIKATCPGCKNSLRVPVLWSDRAMKCKKCGMLVQMRPRPVPVAVAAEPGSPRPYGYPTPLTPGSQRVAEASPESLFPTDDVIRSRSDYDRRPSLGKKLAGLAMLVAAIAGLIVLGMKLQNHLDSSPPQIDGSKPIDGSDDSNAKSSTQPIVLDAFPRRLLFIHISKYVYFNSLAPGVMGRGEDLPSEVAARMAFEFRVPTEPSNNQLFVLCDTARTAGPPPLKNVLAQSFEQFFATSREQDRIMVYFGGHAREIGGKAYLVPVEGDPNEPETLLPVDELYTKLAACKAQQKILIFDVCRFNAGVGSARAGGEPMSEALADRLHAAPPGVQVLTSCSPGQNAQETLDRGSEFLQAFLIKARDRKSAKNQPPAQPNQPIPIDKWAELLREHLAARREGVEKSQTVKATLPALNPEAVAFRKDEPPAGRFAWPLPPPVASVSEVNKLLALAELPGLRKEIELPPGLAKVFPFPADAMKPYEPDVPDAESITDKYPLRKATHDALNYIRTSWKYGDGSGLRETFNGSVTETLKKELEQDQQPIARMILELGEHMALLEKAGKTLSEEKSKRWQALYAYALAQVQLRWAFVNEYNLALGTIKTDNLEKPSSGGTPVYRLVSVEKMRSSREVASKAEAARETFETIIRDHKGTPLEILAKMNRGVALGLTWKLDTSGEATPPKE